MENIEKINLGGGNKRINGFKNLDILPLPNVDIVCDLNQGIPLPDNSVSEVYAGHFLEHINDTLKIIEEIYRVCSPGAKVEIKSPYFKSIGAFKDPTHVSFFTENTFDYFDQNKIEAGLIPDYQTKARFRVKKISYIWSSRCLRYVPGKKFLMKYLWNIARTICYELEVIK